MKFGLSTYPECVGCSLGHFLKDIFVHIIISITCLKYTHTDSFLSLPLSLSFVGYMYFFYCFYFFDSGSCFYCLKQSMFINSEGAILLWICVQTVLSYPKHSLSDVLVQSLISLYLVIAGVECGIS